MAQLSVSTINPATGLVVSTLGACNAGGDSFPNSGRTFLAVKNGSGGALTVLLDNPNPDNFGYTGTALDQTLSVAAGETRIFGPFLPARFNDANGLVQMTYPGGVTSLTLTPFAA
jgi:hypothetical protein